MGKLRRTVECIIVPEGNYAEAASLPLKTTKLFGVATLREALGVVDRIYTDLAPNRPLPIPESPSILSFKDIQDTPEKAKFVAAAEAGRSVLFIGPPGAGKTMLGRRYTTVLPPMSMEERLEIQRIYSICGLIGPHGIHTRPFRAPHHTCSTAALVGGGSGIPRPGEVSLAHRGILFLDELPEFRGDALERVSQVVRDKHVEIYNPRYGGAIRYPADFILVGAMNPCPCGLLGDPRRRCVCEAGAVERYLSKIDFVRPLFDEVIEVRPAQRRPNESEAEIPGAPNS